METKEIIGLLNELEGEIAQLRVINEKQYLELKGYRLIERLLGYGNGVSAECVDVLYHLREAKRQLNIKLEEDCNTKQSTEESIKYKDDSIKRLRFEVQSLQAKQKPLDSFKMNESGGPDVVKSDAKEDVIQKQEGVIHPRLNIELKVGDRVRFDHTLEGVIRGINNGILNIEDDSCYFWDRTADRINSKI
jgi:hypothetical protein